MLGHLRPNNQASGIGGHGQEDFKQSPFRFHREIKSTADKQKLREFSTIRPAFQQTLKEIL